MLHPAFELLFHSLRAIGTEPNPEDEYESHINRFIEMMTKQGNVNITFELLGETHKKLWKENRALAIESSRDSLTDVLNRRAFLILLYNFLF